MTSERLTSTSNPILLGMVKTRAIVVWKIMIGSTLDLYIDYLILTTLDVAVEYLLNSSKLVSSSYYKKLELFLLILLRKKSS